MTGEMAKIDQEGNDSNGESWPIHAAVAKALQGTLHPFDVYQGPYILADGERYWVHSENGEEGYIYAEYAERKVEFFPLQSEEAVLSALADLLELVALAKAGEGA